MAAESREEYGRALAATSRALSDPVASILDTTFLTVILLGLFDVGYMYQFREAKAQLHTVH
jgi:hypothetical protein